MESLPKGTWIETMDNGTLYFKNVSLQSKEVKEPKDGDKEYEHTEANCILELTNTENIFDSGAKFYHTELDQFVTISKVEFDEDDKPTKYLLKIADKKDPIELKPNQTNLLQNKLELTIRVLSKTGIKNTIHGQFDINEGLTQEIKSILEISGLNASRYKLLTPNKQENSQIELPKDIKLETIYDPKNGIWVFAVESLGKASKWKRFATHYEGSEWSNSGSSADGIIFKPTKDILFSGFSTWAPKTEPKYEMKYKIEVAGKVICQDQNRTEYSKFEDTYYNRVMFDTPYEVKADQKIKMTWWISKYFNHNENVYTYYGTNGSDYATIQNEHMGLFEIDASDDSGNGTSVFSGNFPEIFYYI